jgi:hypothetical protein
MTITTEFRNAVRPQHLVLVGWALVTFAVALLPEGVGGPVRAANATLFLTTGPALALISLLLRHLPPAVATVIALGTSLTVLVVGSQALLIVGLWHASAVTGLVAVATIALTVYSARRMRPATMVGS